MLGERDCSVLPVAVEILQYNPPSLPNQIASIAFRRWLSWLYEDLLLSPRVHCRFLLYS